MKQLSKLKIRKIKNLLTDLRRKFGNELIVISGGAKDGADKHVKKYALEFEIEYKEESAKNNLTEIVTIDHSARLESLIKSIGEW